MQFFSSRIGFVPTMGALHEGHLSLIRAAQRDCKRVVVSIFVNPTQFEPHEDFEVYPRDLEGDRALLKEMGVTEVWLPSIREIYPEGVEQVVRIFPPDSLIQILCGKDRPHHFSGVARVVKRLFEHVQPTDVYFGQKDYQQTRVIDWLIQAYFPSIRLHVEPTVREQNGLALSSRNSYLSAEERHVAPQLHDSLQKVRSYFGEGVRRSAVLLDLFRASLSSPLFS